MGQDYFVPYFGEPDMKYGDIEWLDDPTDITLWKRGMVCKTAEEAEKLHDEIVSMARKIKGFGDGE